MILMISEMKKKNSIEKNDRAWVIQIPDSQFSCYWDMRVLMTPIYFVSYKTLGASLPAQTNLASLQPHGPTLSLLSSHLDSQVLGQVPFPHTLYTCCLLSALEFSVLCDTITVPILYSFSRTSQPTFTHSCFVKSLLLETQRKEICKEIRKNLGFCCWFFKFLTVINTHDIKLTILTISKCIAQ